MAYLLPRCLILHVPKTGSDWVRAACQASVTEPIRELGQWHCDLDTARSLLASRRRAVPLVATFVRHPLAWYRSVWCYWKETGRFPREDGTPNVECDEFEEFVRNCFHVAPEGYLSTLYDRFTGPPSDEVDYIGRQAMLVDDLVRFLRVAGEEFDERALRATPPCNVRGSRPSGLFSGYSMELSEEILRREQRAIRRFGYGADPTE